jgi:hypothetical protein
MRKEKRMQLAIRRRIRIALLVMSVLTVLPVAWLVEAANSAHDDRGATSGWMVALRETVAELVLPLIMDERTTYAPGYREEAFCALKRGASQATVLAQLGEPLARHSFPDGETVWYYSKQTTGTDNYHLRNVVFDHRGAVVRKVAEFYVD